MPELILGLDVGTSSARAVLVDLSGQIVGSAQRPLKTSHPAPGLAEQNPNVVWRSVETTIAMVLESAAISISDIATLGLTTQRSSVVVWDRRTGEPLTPLILWTDLRGSERAAELVDAGFLAAPFAANAKLEAAVDAIDRGKERAAQGELAWGTLDSFILHRLTGGTTHATDYSCGWSTCYLDMEDLRSWNRDAIAFQNLDSEMFPDLCDTYGALGVTAKSVLGAEIPIGSVVADQQSGMFAHGALKAGRWKATFGTSATLMLCTGNTPVFESSLVPMLQFGQAQETVFAVEGMVVSGGALLDWLVDDLGLFQTTEELLVASASVETPEGVSICPALQGLGAPHHKASRRGAILGLSGATKRAHIARAALESICFRVREIAESAQDVITVPPYAALPVDGGLSVSHHFLQVLADLLGRPVARHREAEATALGACLAAGIGSGLLDRSVVLGLDSTEPAVDPSISAEIAGARFSAWLEAVGSLVV